MGLNQVWNSSGQLISSVSVPDPPYQPNPGPVRLARSSSGRFFPVDTLVFGTTTGAVAANTLYAFPFSLELDSDSLALEVTTALANSNGRMGVYDSDAKGMPGNLIIDCGQVATTPTGTKLFPCVRSFGEPTWIAAVFSHAVTLRTGQASNRIAQMLGHTALGTAATQTGVQRAHAFGPLPASFGAPTLAANMFMLAVRGV